MTKKPDDKIEDDFDIVDESGLPDTDADDDKEQKPKPAANDDDGDDGEDDDEADKAQGTSDDAGGETAETTDEELEAKRARRRDEKRQKRERSRLHVQRLEEEVAQLRAGYDRVNQAQHESARSATEDRLREHKRKYDIAKSRMAEAIREGDGDSYAHFDGVVNRIRRDHASDLAKLQQLREPQRAAPQGPDPQIQRLAREWNDRNSWYSAGAKDGDSAVVNKIDADIAASGVKPNSSLYWKLLDDQVREALPHRFGNAKKAEARSGPPVVSGKTTRAGNTNTVRISAQRKDALMKAGVWGDKEKMAPYLRAYAEYDKANKTR